MDFEAVLFDLHGTIGYVKNPITSEEISDFLLEHRCDVYPQSLDAASFYVSMIDYPKHGYADWGAYLKQVLRRLDVEIDSEMLKALAKLYAKRRSLTLFQDAPPAVRRAKALGLKTALVTTIAHFCFRSALAPIRECFDFIMTGYEAGCEKSNPKMHKLVLENLGVLPDAAVMIGDEPLVDIKIPKKMGMHTIFLDRRSKTRRKPNAADAKATTLPEAVAVIEKWLKGMSPANVL
jgi:HAD superfamily hydrolase (TIGR01549 family)